MGDHNFEQNPISKTSLLIVYQLQAEKYIVSTERELIKRAGKILAE